MPLNSGCSYTEIIDGTGAGRTVLAHLVATRAHSSPAEWLRRIEFGEVVLDGVTAVAETVLCCGQTLVWHRPAWLEPDVPLHFTVLHEDEDLVAVVKPRGLPTMPAGGFLDGTLLTLVRARLPEASPLHRLGRETSGIVLFSRTHAAASSLARAWRDHAVKKQYRALGAGVAAWQSLDVTAKIGPVPHPALGTVFAAHEDGKASHSHLRVLHRGEDRTLFLVDITTGRPHQIRIHLAYAGHPLVGDPLYDVGGLPLAAPGLPGDGGYYLHAERLSFVHPRSGAPMELHAPPPGELREQPGANAQALGLLDRLRLPPVENHPSLTARVLNVQSNSRSSAGIRSTSFRVAGAPQ